MKRRGRRVDAAGGDLPGSFDDLAPTAISARASELWRRTAFRRLKAKLSRLLLAPMLTSTAIQVDPGMLVAPSPDVGNE